ncbi:MAG: tetratricopeptide repeat protein, partial [Solimonas sp.]
MDQGRGHSVSDDALARFAADRSSSTESRQVLRHLLAGCKHCVERLRLVGWPPAAGEPQGPFPPPDDSYDEAFTAAARASAVELRRRRLAANALLAELEEFPAEQRELWVRNLRRYACPQLVQALVEKSRNERSLSLDSMLHWAQLAAAAADSTAATLGETALAHDCRARARAQLGNAHRIRSEITEARYELAKAQSHIESGTGDVELRAWLLHQHASFARTEGDFGRAIQCAQEAAALYRSLHDRTGEVGALIGLSLVRIDQGDPAPAVPELIRCLDLLYLNEVDLVLRASHNLILCYIDLAQLNHAYDLIAVAEPQIEQCTDELSKLRWKWQQGKV